MVRAVGRSRGNGGRGRRVAVFGGGVAGLTTAHELALRGFEVELFELRSIGGGKARSMAFAGSGKDGRPDLPGEHGFRFFPGFYRHVFDTMRRIPYRDQANGVFDNLVETSRTLWASEGHGALELPTRAPKSLADMGRLVLLAARQMGSPLGLSARELQHFTMRLLMLLTSCEARRFGELEHVDWWTFVGAEERSPMFQRYLVDGLSRCLVAVRGREISTRTGGFIFLQLVLDLLRGGCNDRVLSGPTNDVWIDPWLEELDRLGVRRHMGARVLGLDFQGGAIRGASVDEDGDVHRVEADQFVCALPVEVARRLFTPAMRAADPSLARLDRLRTAWMNGLQLYLDRALPLLEGHVACLDSPWALTAVAQTQFWRGRDISKYGDGRAREILSVDISNWDRPGVLFDKPAMRCSPEEIQREVWAQLLVHVSGARRRALREARVISAFLDPAIVFPNPHGSINLEPIVINTTGSWEARPDAATRIEGLYLAADYVRTHTDLASMEGANEAARRAVNSILEKVGSTEPRCVVWPLAEPAVFAPLRRYDAMRFERGLPHVFGPTPRAPTPAWAGSPSPLEEPSDVVAA